MNWDKTLEEISVLIILLMLCLFIGVLLYAMVNHESMMHNVDLIYNSVKNPSKVNTYIDEYEYGKFVTFKQLYINSMLNLRQKTYVVTFASLGIGIIIGAIFVSTTQTINNDYDKRKQRIKSVQINKRKKGKIKK